MTSTQFATTHGDPTTWTPADIEAQQNLAACDQHDNHVAAAVDFTLHARITDRTPDRIRRAA